MYISIALNAEIIKYSPIQDNAYGSDLMLLNKHVEEKKKKKSQHTLLDFMKTTSVAIRLLLFSVVI
jgi:hypothetical protein